MKALNMSVDITFDVTNRLDINEIERGNVKLLIEGVY